MVSIGTPEIIITPFVPNGKLVNILGVQKSREY